MIVLGIDPGLASCGAATIERRPSGMLVCWNAEVIRTKPQAKKRRLRQAQDRVQRAILLREALRCTLGGMGVPTPDLVAIEEMPYLRQASATQAVALAYGVLVGVLNGQQCATYAPQEVRDLLGLKRNASKGHVAMAVVEAVADLGPLRKLSAKKDEHAWDAAALAVVALR